MTTTEVEVGRVVEGQSVSVGEPKCSLQTVEPAIGHFEPGIEQPPYNDVNIATSPAAVPRSRALATS